MDRAFARDSGGSGPRSTARFRPSGPLAAGVGGGGARAGSGSTAVVEASAAAAWGAGRAGAGRGAGAGAGSPSLMPSPSGSSRGGVARAAAAAAVGAAGEAPTGAGSGSAGVVPRGSGAPCRGATICRVTADAAPGRGACTDRADSALSSVVGVSPSSANGSSALARSSGVAYRSSGDFRIVRTTTAASPSGTPGASVRIGTGSLAWWPNSFSGRLPVGNGTWPVSMWYSVQPSE